MRFLRAVGIRNWVFVCIQAFLLLYLLFRWLGSFESELRVRGAANEQDSGFLPAPYRAQSRQWLHLKEQIGRGGPVSCCAETITFLKLSLEESVRCLTLNCPEELKEDAVTALIDQWIRRSPLDTLRAAKDIGEQTMLEMYVSAIAEHSELTLETALKLCEDDCDGSDRYFRTFVDLVMSRWCSSNLSIVVNWLGDLDSTVRVKMLKVVVPHIVSEDLVQALEILEEYASDVDFSTRRKVGATLVKEDVLSGLDWIRATNDGREREVAVRSALVGLASSDPEDAISHALSLASEVERNDALGDILGEIAASDPAAASVYLTIVYGSGESRQAAAKIYREYVKQDVEGVGNWILTLNNLDHRDYLIGEYAQDLSEIDPKSAREWAIRIRNVEERQRRLKQASQIATRGD